MTTYRVTTFNVSFWGAMGEIGETLGVIELKDGPTIRGYIYLMNLPDSAQLPEDRLGGDGAYIVMHQRAKYLDGLLTVLNGPKPLEASYNDGFARLDSPDHNLTYIDFGNLPRGPRDLPSGSGPE